MCLCVATQPVLRCWAEETAERKVMGSDSSVRDVTMGRQISTGHDGVAVDHSRRSNLRFICGGGATGNCKSDKNVPLAVGTFRSPWGPD